MSLSSFYHESPIGALSQNLVASFVTLAEETADGSMNHKINPGKWIAIPLIFLILLFCCLFPHLLVRWKKGGSIGIVLALLTCLSGGAMLGIGLTHILPHSTLYWETYLTPVECREDHSGHAHFVIKPEDPTYVDLTPFTKSSASGDFAANAVSGFQFKPQLSQPFHPLQSVDPIAPTTPGEEDVHADCAHEGHLYPYAHMICGVIILLLMGVESLLHAYLAKRGNNSVHLHVHADGQCHHHDDDDSKEHSHNHHHHHEHEHEHQHEPELPTNVELSPMSPSLDPGNSSNTADYSAVDVKGDAPQLQDDSTPIPNSPTPEPSTDGEIAPLEPQTDAERIQQFRRTIDAYISAIAIGLHCIFNGLALGSISVSDQAGVSAFWTLFGVTVAHKFCDGFAVGIPLMRAKLSKLTTGVIIFLVCISTPLGIIIGYFATEGSNNDGKILSQAVLLALSSGSFFYIALLELIPNGVAEGGKDWIILKWTFVLVGFAVPAVIANWA